MSARNAPHFGRSVTVPQGVLTLTVAMALFGCQGLIGEPKSNDVVPDDSSGTPPEISEQIRGQAAFRRLSPSEIEASVRDLATEFGVEDAVSAPLIATPDVRYQFSNTADTGNFNFDQVRNLMSWAEAISLAATADVERLLGCSPTVTWDPCISGFVARLGGMAYRRPMTTAEVDTFRAVFEDVAGQADAQAGVRAVWELILQSPQFWFLSNATRPGASRLTSHAIAARLSYALWGTMPDAALRASADRDELRTGAQVRAQAERMLADPRAEAMVRRFHREWLHVDNGADLDKDATVYPAFDGELAQDIDEEFDRYVRQIVFNDGNIEQLLAGRYGYVNQRLEPLFGVEATSSGPDDWIWRELGPERAGLLSRPLFLASNAGRSESSLINRGVAVMEDMLCTVLRAPANATEEAVEIPPDATSGKMLGVQNRASKPSCAFCHDTIDPIGITFEVFDAVGGFRTAYPDGVEIEPSGSLDERFVDEVFDYPDAASLMAGLAAMPKVQQCYASKWIEWATGRIPSEAQVQEVQRIAQTGQTSIRALLLEVVTSRLLLDWEES